MKSSAAFTGIYRAGEDGAFAPSTHGEEGYESLPRSGQAKWDEGPRQQAVV
jgi:hypothetical protein